MEGYNYTFVCHVRVPDLDYTGRVSQAAVLNFFQEARLNYLSTIGNYGEMNIGDGAGIIQTEAHVFFLNEIFIKDELEIGVRVSEFRKASFQMSYRIERKGVTVAEGTTLMVAFDYQNRKPCRLPTAFLTAIASFENLA